jgi:ABC-type glycerol-3-phosphate transport system substrate-binding protein
MAGAKKRLLAVPAFGAAIALLVAGCGGGGGGGATTGAEGTTTTTTATTTTSSGITKAEYVREMKVIGQSLSTSLNTLGSATTAAKAATALAKVQTDLRSAGDKLEAITPPDQIKTQHAQLVKAVRDFADELDPVIKNLKAGKMAALSTVPTLKGLTEIQTASTAISNKGYKIGG